MTALIRDRAGNRARYRNWMRGVFGLILLVMMSLLLSCNTGSRHSEDYRAVFADCPQIRLTIPSLGKMEQKDVALVEQEMNILLGERYGLQVILEYIDMGIWNEEINVRLAREEELEIFAVVQAMFTTYVTNGCLMELTGFYQENGSLIREVFPEEYLKGTTLDGELYSIATFRNYSNRFVLEMEEELVLELGIDPDTLRDLDAVEEVLYQVKDKYPDKYPIIPQTDSSMVGTWSWDGLGDEAWIGVTTDFGQSETVKNVFETEAFTSFVTRMRAWYLDGLIMPDALSNTEPAATLIRAGKAFSYFNNATQGGEVEGIVRSADLIPAWSQSNSYAAFSYGISSFCREGEKAWELLSVLYTDEDIMSLLVNGVQGEHWAYADESVGQIALPAGKSEEDIGYQAGMIDSWWIYPNAELTPTWIWEEEDRYQKVKEQDEMALKSKGIGFVFDASLVKNEYSACVNVMNKYYEALLCGAVDPETTIYQANKELEAAGLDRVLKEKQRQYTLFLEGK